MRKIKTKPYDKLALVYDHLMNHVNYNLWTRYVYKITKQYLIKNPSVLELAGGNGKFSNIFRKYYPDIIVTDISLPMLNNNFPLQKICCEMTNLPFKKKFDLIYSTFDSVNYLLNKKDILKLFAEVKKILKPEGVFTFDVSLEKNSELYVSNHEQNGKISNISYEHTSIYNKYSKIHRNIFEIKMEDGIIFKEIHKQRIYSFEVFFDLLNEAGMYVVECLEAFTYKSGNKNSRRIQFITKGISDAFIQ